MLACLTLLGGVWVGVPMRPAEIEDLMSQMNRPKIAHVLPAEDEEGDDE
jgi:hypothetical protein